MHIYEDSSMGKRRPTWDYQHYLRYLKEGRGQGTGADYKPWIYIHDFPSRGISAHPSPVVQKRGILFLYP